MKLREQLPELTGATAWINEVVSNEQLVGEKATLIHFWSVSCYLCKETMPEINELRDEYVDDLNVVAVHMPRSEDDLDINVIEAMAMGHDITQPIFIDSEHKLTVAFENKYVPAYYLFDKEGKLRHFQAGGSGMPMLRKRIERVLNENKHKLNY
ncbi:Thiol-disulfide isomerase or thioredoxin [Bacillus sp. OV166]|uniref:TlpA family protein disulfide reductase n=1 Tax=Bacillus sp. OV166 TaxID=1882763 RepID=UPI000A2AC8C7|nr:TlpA disulfide reductase family protein [Bacillus sp. OV166]SMQ87060.1 Thiol-disulfide isomerase or thioredoxin [Bacillus sp. OV166]